MNKILTMKYTKYLCWQEKNFFAAVDRRRFEQTWHTLQIPRWCRLLFHGSIILRSVMVHGSVLRDSTMSSSSCSSRFPQATTVSSVQTERFAASRMPLIFKRSGNFGGNLAGNHDEGKEEWQEQKVHLYIIKWHSRLLPVTAANCNLAARWPYIELLTENDSRSIHKLIDKIIKCDSLL